MQKLVIFTCLLVASTLAFNSQDPSLSKYKIDIIKSGKYTHFPKKGNEITVHYTGTLLSGTKFDSSKDRNQPFKFKVGQGQVIKCWDEVGLQMTLGDHIKVLCPSNTAYGSRGAGSLIPPNSDLYFEIEMIEFEGHPKSNYKEDF